MTQRARTSPLLAISERIYRQLLILYPPEYRREYGWQMTQVFRDLCRDAYRDGGAWGVARWWNAALLDLLLSAFAARRKAGIHMDFRPFFSRFCGVLLMIGGVLTVLCSFSQLQPVSRYNYYGIYQILIMLIVPAYAFVAFGILGLIMRYGDKATLGGRLLFYLAGSGALAVAIGMTITQFNDRFWVLLYVGMVVHTISLIGFGLLNLGLNALPVPRIIVLLTGTAPLTMILSIFRTNVNDNSNLPIILVMVVSGLAWAIAGYMVQKSQIRLAEATA